MPHRRLVLTAALLALAVAPARGRSVLSPGELRAMRKSAAMAHAASSMLPHRGVRARRLARPAVQDHDSMRTPAPPSAREVGGRVSEVAGVKQWHAEGQGSQPRAGHFRRGTSSHRARAATQHEPSESAQAQPRARKGVRVARWHAPDAPDALDAREQAKSSRAVRTQYRALGGTGRRVRTQQEKDPDAPNAEERAKWEGGGGARPAVARGRAMAVPADSRMAGEYEPVAGGRVRVRPAMHHDAVKDFDNKYEERTWSAAKDSVIQRAEEAFVQHESPRAVHDCGLDGDDCNFSGTGPDDHDLGSYMKAPTQSLAELGRGSWQQRGDAAVSTGERASALAAQQPDAQMQQLWNAARNDASLRSTRERLGLASSARDASEEVARGAAADAVAVAAAGQDYAGNMDQYLSSKAPTQDLSEGGLYNPHKNGYGAAAEWGKVVARLSQQRRQQQQQPPPRAQARSGQGVPSHLVQLAESSANTPAAPAVETVELSHSDIDELAKELYKEASAADRKAASSAASARQTHIRTAVAQAIGRRAPASARPQRGVWRPLARVDRVGLPAAGLVGVGEEPVKVQRGMVGRARALHAAHRAMVWGAGAGAGAGVAGRVWRMRRQQRAMGPTGSAGTVVGQMVAPWQQQREQQALMGSGRMPWSAVPVATESEEEPEVVEGDGETEVAEGGSEEGDMAEADGKHEGRDEGREIEGDPAARDQDEVEAADGEDEESEGQSKEQSDDAEEAPVTYLAGACCDSEGNCKSCPGPDEDYNMWDNLYIFPGDQAGMGRSFTHVLLAILLIIMGVFVASVLLDKRKEETGEHPIDSMYQNAKDLSETVGSSAGNLWRSTVASVSGSKEVCALL